MAQNRHYELQRTLDKKPGRIIIHLKRRLKTEERWPCFYISVHLLKQAFNAPGHEKASLFRLAFQW